MPDRPWHIVGAGSLGTLMALQFRQADLAALLVHHRGGLKERHVSFAGKRHKLAVQWLTSIEPASIDRALICTKAGQVAAAISALAPKLSADAVVIAVANGMGFERSPEAAVLPGGLRRAVTTAGAYRDSDGLVHAVDGGQTVVGDPQDPSAAPPWFRHSLAELPDWSWEPLIAQAVGRKFSINCVINALTASRRCRNGELLTDPEGFKLLKALCIESEPVLRRLGFWDGPSLLGAAEGVCRSTADNRSSMLQDVLAGRQTEIEFLNGELVRLAPNAELPLNRQLLATVLTSS